MIQSINDQGNIFTHIAGDIIVFCEKLPVADKKEISEISTQFGEKIYRVSMQRVELGEIVAGSETLENTDKNVSLIAMYMYDDTELKEYIKKNEDNKLVVALAYLDNYEEALESVEDVRRSLLIALIDRKITKYFSNFDGLVKKLEKDKYFLIMRQSSLDTLKEQRFHILDEVKTVNIGNEMAITLSIGVGLNAATYIQNYEYCHRDGAWTRWRSGCYQEWKQYYLLWR